MMWGVAGTMHAARAMADWTGEERWREAWRESADALWAARDPDGLWTQRLWGMTYRSLGGRTGRPATRMRSCAAATSSQWIDARR